MDLQQLKAHPAFGSYAAIAAVCGVSREAARRWKRIPPKCCPAIEKAVSELTCEILRPDLIWNRDEEGRVTSYCVAIKKKDD